MYNAFLFFTTYHEKNLSTEQSQEKENSWFSCSHGYQGWSSNSF